MKDRNNTPIGGNGADVKSGSSGGRKRARRVEIVEQGIYANYRGALFRVLHCAQDAESGAPIIVYQAIDDTRVLTMRLEDFTGHVSEMGGRFRRFTAPDAFHLFSLDQAALRQ